MNLVDFVNANLNIDNPIVQGVCIGILFTIVHDFYHSIFSAITSWFVARR